MNAQFDVAVRMSLEETIALRNELGTLPNALVLERPSLRALWDLLYEEIKDVDR